MNSTRTKEWDSSIKASIIAMEVVNLCAGAVSVWVLLTMVIYGLKNGLFRKKMSGSSLSSGLIYGSATALVGSTLPCFIMNEIHLHLGNISKLMPFCEALCDVTSAMYVIVFTGLYVILWIHQRLIFSHPSVKTQIPIVIDRLNVIYMIILSLSSAGIMYLYVYPNEYVWGTYTCIAVDGGELESTKVITIVIFVSTYMIPIFSVYAAFRVNFHFVNSRDCSEDGVVVTRRLSVTKLSAGCCRNFVGADGILISPIQMAVRRNVICCFAAVILDIVSIAVSEFAVHRDSGQPMTITWTMYNSALVFKIFLVLALMGTLKNTMSILIPSCW